jgi:hypothetical protein
MITPMAIPAFAPADKPFDEDELPLSDGALGLEELLVGALLLEVTGEPGDAEFVGLGVEEMDVEDSAASILEVMRARISRSVVSQTIGMPSQKIVSPEFTVVVMTCDKTPVKTGV